MTECDENSESTEVPPRWEPKPCRELTWAESPQWWFRWIGSEQRGTTFKSGPQIGRVPTPPLDSLEIKASLPFFDEVRQIF